MIKKKPIIMLFFYRFMEFRLFFQTGLLEKMKKKMQIVIVVPAESIKGVKKVVGKEILVEGSNIGKLTVLDEHKERGLNALISRILAFVYGKKKNKVTNITPKIHFESIKRIAEKKNIFSILIVHFIIIIASMASRFFIIRKLLQKLYALTSEDKKLKVYFDKYRPNLIIVGSCGVSADGWVMLESKKNNVPVAVVLQTWDRTSSKGYPTVQPDYLLTWSHVTALEANAFLDIPKKNIFVEGAPIWDSFFKKKPPLTKEKFCKISKLDHKKKIIVFAMNSLSYHESNLEVMRYLGKAIKIKKFGKDVQLFLRLHPSYFSSDKEKRAMEDVVTELSEVPEIAINRPETENDQSGLLFTKFDQQIQISSFFHCDLTISCLSTYMLESSIFNKPAINLMYGRWKTNLYDLDVSKIKVHHLQRIYDYNAIYQVNKLEDLSFTINKILKNPQEKSKERGKLIDTEIPVNRGNSGEKFCYRLLKLANN
ncbi:MAG: hypothetical protein CBB97_12610 [Candidatus Endolissoclinum sp. TMED37]|nr:MAG: hypothetical protein CBB97_12610 [Candidatus Endolissoclinum sp. TMED37]